MKDRAKRVVLVASATLLALGCVGAGLVALAYFQVSSCIGGLEAPIETPVTTFECPAIRITVLNLRTTNHWLEPHTNEALLRVLGAALDEPLDLRVSAQRFRDWIPESRRPAHRVDGDASRAGFEIYLDPAVVPSAVADDIEECLFGERRQALLDALHSTDAHDFAPSPGVEEGITYLRSIEEVLRPTFTAPSGETIKLQRDGYLSYDRVPGTFGTITGRVTRQPDGALRVALDLASVRDPVTTPASDFRNPDGEDLEAWFGVPITPALE